MAVNGQKSSKNLVLSGIPQGSVLGPLLFVIFINDLPAAVENEAWMFADDTKIYQEVNCKEDGESLQNDLYRLEDWSKKWLLLFHPKKAKILKFGRAKKLEREYYAERGKLLPISSDNTETDLGVTIDSDLKFEKHIMNKVNKANRLVGLIKRTFQLDILKFRFLFRGIVRPHLECHLARHFCMEPHVSQTPKPHRECAKKGFKTCTRVKRPILRRETERT